MSLMDSPNMYCVVGPPGCGKTYSISQSVERNIERYGKRKVMVCSLTKAAAVEAAGRIKIDRSQVGTLHSFAYRSLGSPEIAEAHTKEWNEHYPSLAMNSSGDMDDQTIDTRCTTGEGDNMLADYNIRRSLMRPRPSWPGSLQLFAKKWEQWKDECGYYDFTDLIERAALDVDFAPGSPDVIYMDEAQDSSTLEGFLLRRWAKGIQKCVVVGDPNQSLFEWRGADPDEFFPQGMDMTRRAVLGQSYRVPEAVLETSLNWIKRMPGYNKEEYKPRNARGHSEYLNATLGDPSTIAGLIERKMGDGKTVMVLASCGYMLKPLIAFLKDKGIPFHNPYRRRSGLWNPLHNKSRATILSWLAPREDLWFDDARIWSASDVKKWASVLEAKDIIKRGMKKRLDAVDTEDLVSHIQMIFNEQSVDRIAEQDFEWWRTNIMKSKRSAFEFPFKVLDTRGPEVLAGEPQCIVGTVHSVKGGQSDVVIVSPELSYAAKKGMYENDKPIYRLFYVAMTRAREELYLLKGVGNSNVHW